MAETGIMQQRRAQLAQDKRSVKAVQIATLAVLIIIWEVTARSGWLYEGVVPSILTIGSALFAEVSSPSLYGHFGVTLIEILAGFIIAVLAGVITGIALGSRRIIASVADPFLTSLATTPKIVFLPVVMLMVGIGPESKVAVGALSGFFPVVLSTMAGMLTIRPVMINVAKSFNASAFQMLTKVYLRSLVGPIIRGMRIGLGVTVIGVLLGEIKLSNSGLGYLAIDYYNRFNVASMYAILILIFVLAVVLNGLMTMLNDRYDHSEK